LTTDHKEQREKSSRGVFVFRVFFVVKENDFAGNGFARNLNYEKREISLNEE
jgi:hypothetical protein